MNDLYIPTATVVECRQPQRCTTGAMKLSEKEFDRIVKTALRRIAPEVRQHLDNILISVQKRPSKRMLRETGTPPGETILGLFQGVSLIERSVTSPPLFPDTILLFQEPLEGMCETMEQLEEQIEITVVHEVAHFVGMSEDRLAELGYE
jgi:predicted Zn-dependent protease with MMP-like domain